MAKIVCYGVAGFGYIVPATFLPAVGPKGLTFNQFLVDAEEPLLFHCGQRSLTGSNYPLPEFTRCYDEAIASAVA